MANVKGQKFVDRLNEYAWEYIQECIGKSKEVATTRGAVDLKERHIPTIDYFLRIWIPLNHSKKDTIKRSTYYRWLKWNNTNKQTVIKNIDLIFSALATDIVANEGKGIFYAKNKLGMSDKIEQKNDNTHLLTGKAQINVISTGVPLSNDESEVDAR